MPIGEPKFEITKPTEFRQLIEDLVKSSDTLKDVTIDIGGVEEKINILDAIENNGLVVEYVENNGSDKKRDAVDCLIYIYDELKKDKPNDDFIKEAVERLKDYL